MSAENQKTILLVEDEMVIAMVEKFTIEKFGYNVITANSGEEAVDTVEKTPSIDLILMDIELGAGMDGTEAAEIILRERDIPIVFLSSHTEPEIVAKTEKITSYGYLVKNSGNTVLQALIKIVFKLFEAKKKEKEKEPQREAALETLRESEERQQLILATLPIAIFTSPLDPEIDASWVGGDVEKVTGFTVDQYMAEKDFWRNHLHPDDRERVLDAYKNPAAADEIILEYRWLCKDGNYKWFYDRTIKKRNPHGVQYFGIILDITERKRAEHQVRERVKELQAFYSLAEITEREGISLDKLYQELVDILPKSWQYPEIACARIVMGDSEFRSENFAESAWQQSAPVRVNGSVVGRLEVGYLEEKPKEDEGPFLKEERLLIDAIAERIERITERKRVEQLFQTVFENMGTALIIIEENTIISHMNAGMEKICGYKKEEIEGLVKWPKLVVEEDLKKMLEYHSQRRIDPDSAPGSYEFRLIHKTGELRDAALTAAMVPGTKKSVISIRDITERKQAEEEIKRQLLEKKTLLKEVHHRIKNNIASVGSLLSLHSQSTANPEAVAVLQDAIGRVNSMRILYDKLLLSEDYKDISVKNYLNDLIDTIIAIFPNQAKVIFEKHIADFHLDARRLFPLGIITNELLTNKMKYAFSNGDTGLIKISLANVDNHVTLTIQDNGKGFPAGFDINASEGFGLKLVKMLSQQLGGSFSIENQAGNRCMIEFNI